MSSTPAPWYLPPNGPYGFVREQQIVIRQQQAIEAMLAKGWCVHKVRHLAQEHGCQNDDHMFRFLLQWQRNDLRLWDHSPCLEATKCIAYDVNMDTYTSQHVRPDCNCQEVFIDHNELVRTIEQGKIPLVSLETSRTKIPSLALTTRQWHSSYTAISHLWIDGLGNSKANSLPLCQLENLNKHLKGLTGNSKNWFWLDTLCLPIANKHNHLRPKSIDMMPSIYGKAKYVLVLDAELMSMDTFSFPWRTIRTVMSEWMYRSWTLLEALYATRWAFQFRDELLVTNSYESNKSIMWADEWYSVRNGRSQRLGIDHQEYGAARYLKEDVLKRLKQAESDDSLFAFLWTQLSARSTARPDDVYQILAIVLDLDHQPLLALEPEHRLPAIIYNLSHIPLSLLSNDGPRLDAQCYPDNGWVPTELSSHPFYSKTTLSVKNGFMVLPCKAKDCDYTVCFISDAVFLPRTFCFLANAQDAGWYEIRLLLPEDSGPLDQKPQDLCLIIENRLLLSSEYPGTALRMNGYTEAPNQTNLEAEYICPIRVTKYLSEPPTEIMHASYVVPEHVLIKHEPVPEFDISLKTDRLRFDHVSIIAERNTKRRIAIALIATGSFIGCLVVFGISLKSREGKNYLSVISIFIALSLVLLGVLVYKLPEHLAIESPASMVDRCWVRMLTWYKAVTRQI